MHQGLGLSVKGFPDDRGAMPQSTDGDAADKVEVLFALVVPEATSFSPNKGQRDSRIGLEHVFVCQCLYIVQFIIHTLTLKNLREREYYQSIKLEHYWNCESKPLRYDLCAYADLCEDLQKDGMILTAVNNVGLSDPPD